jgi:bacterioferritin
VNQLRHHKNELCPINTAQPHTEEMYLYFRFSFDHVPAIASLNSKFNTLYRVDMADDEVIDLLQEAYNDEIETVMNYLTNSVVLEGVSAEEVKESLRTDAKQEELRHAERIGDRLKELGSRPPASFDFEAKQDALQPPDNPGDILTVIDGVIEYENDAIDTYRSLMEAAQDADDPVTEDLAIEILGEEESHRSEFKSFRREYE